ncbi:MAG: protein phosphatase CheZ [Pseudolabrys sp.]
MQRKVFRVEQMFGGRMMARRAGVRENARPVAFKARAEQAEATDATAEKLKHELALLRDMIAGNKRELAGLLSDGHERRMARTAGELGAAIEGMEKATVMILKSTEVIDESARALTAAVKTDFERGLTQDIQDHVVTIYEACNFQDLSGQRIGNAIATLNMIEDRLTVMLDRCKVESGDAPAAERTTEPGLLNGPRLDGDSGHTSQRDIDVLFD